ncbi:cell division topological specificity factor MinE [Natroniella sulfidigena]|uniref:cell division topological specificity factor MinE n=1 Tax=Natroniella sulfidigena TaxID=723921 RepID=UPI00200B8612|nr:cell division topological specificity factor MinE [Natroniella sulfidigena]
MIDLMKGMFNKDELQSKDLAKERLRLVLVHDRMGVSPEVIEDMKEELIQVISKYLEIDKDGLEMELDRQENSVALVANIPVKQLKKR